MLQDLIAHAGRFDARRPAFVGAGPPVSYGAVEARVRRAAGGLRALGLREGDHVAVAAENGPFYFEAYFAAALAGLVIAPINIRLAPGEVAFILADGDCKALLHDAASAHLVPAGRDLLVVPETAWRALAAEGEPLAGDGPRDEHALAHLCYTSGATGRPKGVMLSHRNVEASATNKLVLGKFARDDVWLHAAPMFHQADSWAVFAFAALGARHVFLPRFDAGRALELLAAERVTAFQLVPTMIVMMLELAEQAPPDLSSLRRILYGSAPMSEAILARAETIFGPVFQHIYGLTEAAGTVAATPWPALPDETTGARRRSCGQPIAGVAMRIADEAGHERKPGEVGRIQVRGANVMSGYWRRPEEAASAFVDGWLDTGDLGHMDGDGFVFIVDRAKDMIITGGENVYSAEVENVLHAHPAIREAACIGLPDARWGEAVTAVVALRDGAAVSEADIVAHCRDRLAGYKCPKSVHILDALPKSGAGKIVKPDLRRMFGG